MNSWQSNKHAMIWLVLLAAMLLSNASTSAAQEPEWYPYTIARGDAATVIKNTPIQLRPNRPFHFYGNAVRREYYRGNPFAMPRDIVKSTTVLLFRQRTR